MSMSVGRMQRSFAFKLALMVAMLLFGARIWGQGAAVVFPGVTNPQGQPVPGVQLHFCTTPTVVTSGVCSTPVTVYQDIALTTPYSSAIRTDGLGNFPAIYFTPAANYCYSVSGFPAATNTCYPFSVSIVSGSSPTFTAMTVTGNETVGGLINNGSDKLAEIAAPGCLAGFDLLWGDLIAHRLKECDNNGAPVQIVHAGVDVNTSDQVTATHLTAALPVAQGGTGVTAAQGNGSKIQLSAGSPTSGNFASFDANANTVDSGRSAPSGAIVGTTDSQAISGKTSYNNIVLADAQAGATADAKIAACIAALPSGGGICDARGFGATAQTWAAQVNLGSATKFVTLLLDKATKYTITISNGTDIAMNTAAGSSVIAFGDHQPQSGLAGFIGMSSTSFAGLVQYSEGSTAGGDIEGLTFTCPTTPTLAAGAAVIKLINPLQNFTVRGNNLTCGLSGILFQLTETNGGGAGPVTIDTNTFDCSGFTGNCTPFQELAVAGGGVMAGVGLSNNNFTHPGTTSNKLIDLQGITGNDCAGVTLTNNYLESRNAADIGVNINNCTNVLINGLVTTANTNVGTDAVKISGSNTDGVVVMGENNFNAWTDSVNNAVLTHTLTGANSTRLSYGYYTNKIEYWIDKTGFHTNHITSGGTIPSTRAVTGAGASGSCIYGLNSTDSMGLIQIAAAGAGPAATGTLTITFTSNFPNAGTCLVLPSNAATAWNPRATFFQTSAAAETATFAWDNNAVALVAASNYQLNYFCFGR